MTGDLSPDGKDGSDGGLKGEDDEGEDDNDPPGSKWTGTEVLKKLEGTLKVDVAKVSVKLKTMMVLLIQTILNQEVLKKLPVASEG